MNSASKSKSISIVIPAHNAAQTLEKTLDSVLAQTYPHWEAVIINDGSSDETVLIAAQYKSRDARFQVVNQPRCGVSRARNTGIELTSFDWLLFLDADDLILPRHLEVMLGQLSSDLTLDGIYCGSAVIAGDGARILERNASKIKSLFVQAASSCPFAIHACLVRKNLVEKAGGFDPTLHTCEDWDLWQRIARAGANFGSIDQILALYCVRPTSLSNNAAQLFKDGLRVIQQAYSQELREAQTIAEYAAGLPVEGLSNQKFRWLTWSAGILISQGLDSGALFDFIRGTQAPELDPSQVADSLWDSLIFHATQKPALYYKVWSQIQPPIQEFLRLLEEVSLTGQLAQRTLRILERKILKEASSFYPLTVGATYGLRLEITEPLPDIAPPASIQRLYCLVEAEGKLLGSLELPVCDKFVPAYLLADAISAEFAWAILELFFRHNLYDALINGPEPANFQVRRKALALTGNPSLNMPEVHNKLGWTVFLQELWGRPDWPLDYFYKSSLKQKGAAQSHLEDNWYAIEVSAALSDLTVRHEELTVVVLVGGTAIGTVIVPVKQNKVTAQQLQVALTFATGLELCRACVREALIGRSLSDPTPLRERLARLAARSSPQPAWFTAASSAKVIDRTPFASSSTLTFGHRTPDLYGTSTSRRALLPPEAAGALVEAAALAGETLSNRLPLPASVQHVLYTPELIHRPLNSEESTTPLSRSKTALPLEIAGGYASQLYRPKRFGRFSWKARTESIEFSQPPALHLPAVAKRILGKGGRSVSKNFSNPITTSHLPILMYHRVAPQGLPDLKRYRVTPGAFKAQLQYLHEAGFYSVSLEEWRIAREAQKPLPGRAILLTFDDGYRDFLDYAWPLLKQYGFGATVFLVATKIGQTNSWDNFYGEAVPLLDWPEILQLQAQGLEFGSHSTNHVPLTALTPAGVAQEAAHSRALLEGGLSRPVRTFAYPYGDMDPTVQHLIGACGYLYGLSCRSGLSQFQDPLLALPRIEIKGSDSLPDFIARLSGF